MSPDRESSIDSSKESLDAKWVTLTYCPSQSDSSIDSCEESLDQTSHEECKVSHTDSLPSQDDSIVDSGEESINTKWVKMTHYQSPEDP